MSWKLVKDLSPYEGWFPEPNEDHCLLRRVYSLDEKRYPILQICIFPNAGARTEGVTGISISNCTKKSKESHWDNWSYIPLELISEVQEMIEIVKAKVLKEKE